MSVFHLLLHFLPSFLPSPPKMQLLYLCRFNWFFPCRPSQWMDTSSCWASSASVVQFLGPLVLPVVLKTSHFKHFIFASFLREGSTAKKDEQFVTDKIDRTSYFSHQEKDRYFHSKFTYRLENWRSCRLKAWMVADTFAHVVLHLKGKVQCPMGIRRERCRLPRHGFQWQKCHPDPCRWWHSLTHYYFRLFFHFHEE